MRTTSAMSLAVSVSLVWLGGCAPQETRRDEPTAPAADAEILSDWQKVYVLLAGGDRVHKGFLHRRFTLENREGPQYVLDLELEVKGFVSESGRTYVYERTATGKLETREVQHDGLDAGVALLLDLGAPSSVRYEPVSDADAPPPRKLPAPPGMPTLPDDAS